jgi:lysophospholipase L1-like esterase
MRQPASGEIRFVCEGKARVKLGVVAEALGVVPFYGCFQHSVALVVEGDEPTTIDLPVPERLSAARDALPDELPFSPDVRRLMLRGGAAVFHSVEAESCRPPRPDEVPDLRMLTYGTSITHGSAASQAHLCYVAQAAARLGVDLINLGVGGSCYCEPELGDYMAAREDWDLAVLALSVNMIGAGFTPDEFYERVSYLVHTVATSDESRPIFCITIYPYFQELPSVSEALNIPTAVAPPEVYRERLRQAVEECPSDNVDLIEGTEILTDWCGLTPDLIHPADNGMIRMGENLARRLGPTVRGLRE